MPTKTAILAVRIVTDADPARKGLDNYGTSVDRLSTKISRLGNALVTSGILYGLERIAQSAATAASDLEQSTGAVEAVFQAHANAVQDLARQASSNVGLAASEYQQLASILGAQLKNMGVSQDNLAGQTDNLITMGADLAAMFGGTTSDAVNALSSLLRGERDPIERYGISIKQADIEAKKAALGLQDLTGDAEKAADMQAVLALLTDQAADANGRFAAEADTAAGAQQRANAAWEDAQAALGEALIPVWAEAAGIAERFAGWVQNNQDLALGLVAAVGILTAAIGLATIAQWLYNIAMAANPIGLIIIAVGLLIGIIVVLITNWQEVEDIAGEVWANITGWVQGFIGWIQQAIDWLGKLFNGEFFNSWLFDQVNMGGAFDVSHHAGTGWDDPDPDSPDGPSGPWPVWSSPLARPSTTSTRPADVINITVNGAIDKLGTARTVRRVLTEAGRYDGRLPAAGVQALSTSR